MKLQSVDISKTASASEIVFEALRKAIIEGELAEGEPLRQDEIARLFNTSRIPVREAISRLEEQGLVRAQRYKGAVVASLSADEAAEIFDFRAMLEPVIIARAVPKMSAALLSEARTYCEAFAKAPEPMQWGELNRKFHAALYSACALNYHLEVANNAMDRIDRYLRAQLVLSNGMPRAISEHQGILEACESGNAALASKLTEEHIRGARDALIPFLINR